MKSFPTRHDEYQQLWRRTSTLVLDGFSKVPTRRADYWRLWRDAYREFALDLKNTRWLRGFGWFCGLCWFGGLVAAGVLVSLTTTLRPSTACLPDGSFRLHPEKYSMWSSSGFFQITLGGGRLTFPQAKIVDVAFDILVGRGGQFLLAFVSWKVFAMYLTVSMEVEPVSYQIFRTVFFDKEASLPSTYGTIKAFLYQRKLRSKLAMSFMVLTMLFILVFPTMTSAMSGYDGNVGSYLPDYSGTLVPFQEFDRVLYVVVDGDRINKTGNYWVTDQKITSLSEPVLTPGFSSCTVNQTVYPMDYEYYDPCRDAISVSEYVRAYGLNGKTNKPTVFYDQKGNVSHKLGAPSLNISVFSIGEYIPSFYLAGFDDASKLPMAWNSGDSTFDLTYVEKYGTCKTINSYQWGFSFLQLFICIIILLLWTVGIFIMWLHAHFTMALRKRHPDDISGELRAVLELAEAMREELDLQDTDASLLREEELKEQVNKRLKGGAISYVCSDGKPDTHVMRKALWGWLKREKWWVSALIVNSIICATVWTTWLTGPISFWIWTFGLWLGQVCAFCISTTVTSRVFMISIWCIIAAIAAIATRNIGIFGSY